MKQVPTLFPIYMFTAANKRSGTARDKYHYLLQKWSTQSDVPKKKSVPFTTLHNRTATSVEVTKRSDGYIRLQYSCMHIISCFWLDCMYTIHILSYKGHIWSRPIYRHFYFLWNELSEAD